jgi:hypothetical protein
LVLGQQGGHISRTVDRAVECGLDDGRPELAWDVLHGFAHFTCACTDGRLDQVRLGRRVPDLRIGKTEQPVVFDAKHRSDTDEVLWAREPAAFAPAANLGGVNLDTARQLVVRNAIGTHQLIERLDKTVIHFGFLFLRSLLCTLHVCNKYVRDRYLHALNALPILTPMSDRNRLPRRINDRLLAEIRRQGRRVNWVADQLGVSQYALWRYETGRSAPPSDWYERAATVLGVAVEDIEPQDVVAA